MSPLELELLLRAYSMPRPNQDLPAERAYAPAMVETINSFRHRGLLKSIASPSTLRVGYGIGGGGFAMMLTEKGEALAARILAVAAECYKEAE